MSLAYLEIEYQFGSGPKKHAVHGLRCTQFEPDSPTFSEEDAIFWGALQNIDAAYDSATDVTVVGAPAIAPTLIAALVRYHRGMHAVGTTINAFRLYNGPTFVFTEPLNHRVELNLPCKGVGVAYLPPSSQNADSLATGNVALLIDKSSATFGGEGGQIWLRYACAKESTTIGDSDGVSLINARRPTTELAHQNVFNPGSTMDLANWCTFGSFGGGPGVDADGTPIASSGAQYVIINTTKVVGAGAPHLPAGSRYISGHTLVGALTVDDAQSRQYNRKGKKKVVA